MHRVSTLDATIALGGYSIGLAVGCLNNLWKTGSLLKKPNDAPKNGSFVVRHLAVNRDKSICPHIIKPKIWHPFLPLEHLGPLTLIVITQVVTAILSPRAAATASAISTANYALKIIISPIVLNAAVVVGAFFLRSRVTPYVRKMGIDPSGHAIAQSSSAIYKLFVFSALSSLNLTSNPYRMVAAVTTLSDCLWTHRTASSYHSVMDMAFATILVGISFGTVYAGHRIIATYAPRAARLLIAKTSKLIPGYA